jgi:hypothetical protein
MRSPLPAARIIAFMHALRPATRNQLTQLRQFGTATDHFIYIGEETRHVAQVARFAVAVADAGEDADHLQVALHAHQVAGALEVFEVGCTGMPAACACCQ